MNDSTVITSTDLQDITKEFILRRVSQEEIFQRYMGRPVELHCKFLSPLRADNSPTCTMKYFRGKLIFRDWALPYAMDCFDFVQAKYTCTYDDALRQIASDFELSDKDPELNADYLNQPPRDSSKSNKKRIHVKIQKFTEQDKEYLRSYHLGPEQMKKFKVLSLKSVWLNDELTYYRNDQDPVLGYYFGKDEEGNQRWKIYFYRRTSGIRFICNTNRIQGWVQLPEKDDVLVFTKSLKDVMVLDLFGIPAIAMQSEGLMPYPRIIDELEERFGRIYSLYDFDRAGIHGAQKLKQRYGIQPLFLTNGRFGSVDRGCKDISDYIQANGLEKTESLLQEAIDALGLKYELQTSW